MTTVKIAPEPLPFVVVVNPVKLALFVASVELVEILANKASPVVTKAPATPADVCQMLLGPLALSIDNAPVVSIAIPPVPASISIPPARLLA